MIKFRKARTDDKTQIAKLMIKLHKDLTYDEALAEMDFLMKIYCFIVATDENKIVAYAYGKIRRDYVEGSLQLENAKVGYLESIYVLPKYRKNGIAKKLCELLENWAKSKGATEFASDCVINNKSSYKFHKAIGFEDAGTIIHFIKKI